MLNAKRIASLTKGANKIKKKSERPIKNPASVSAIAMEDLERAFSIFDKDNNGTISKDEVGNVLKEADIQFSPTQLDVFMKKLDKDGDGEVDYGEFCGLMKDLVASAVTMEDELQEAFAAIDVDGDGHVSPQELRGAVMSLGESITEKEADEIVKAVDNNGDAHIDYEEFVTLMFMLNICPASE